MLECQFIDSCLGKMAHKGVDDQDWHKRALLAFQAKRMSINICEKELLRRHPPEPKSKPKASAKTKARARTRARAKANSKKMKPLNVTSVDKHFMQKAEAMLSPELFKAIYRPALQNIWRSFEIRQVWLWLPKKKNG
jgi:hypothetical protein